MAQQNEIIFIQTDLLFNFALNVVNELHQAQRVHINHFQEAYLDLIQSNVVGQNNTDCFGSPKNISGAKRRTCFSKAVSNVLRHLMLNATGIPESAWPGHHRRGKQTLQIKRNHKNMRTNFSHPSSNHFKLTENATAAQHYYSSYDHQFPLYQIESRLANVQVGHLASISGEMIIFRYNAQARLTHIVDIISTCGAVEDPTNVLRMSKAYARVICIVHSVLDGEDGESLKTLNTMLPKQVVEDEAKKSMLETYGSLIPENPELPCDVDMLCKEFHHGLNVTKGSKN